MDYAPFARPLYVMAKPAGAQCNLQCSYCYYLEKKHLYKESDACRHIMSDALLEHFIREYIAAQTMPQVLFTWHGGEPLLRPLPFYRKVLALQRQYADGHHIDNCIQTNGILLTDDWCRFFKENQWLVGISIDGPEEYHDAFRRSRTGTPSFAQVMKGIELLDKHGVEWNAMAAIHSHNISHPLEFYRLFKHIGCHYIQFTPVVERLHPHADGRMLVHSGDKGIYPLTSYSVTPEQWGTFLCTLFDEWIKTDVGRYFIQIFDATLANWAGVPPGICSLSPTCGHAAAMEYNGDLYSCDHFVFPEYKLGNILTHSLTAMLYGEQQSRFAHMKQSTLPTQCHQCRYLFACHGECPKNRFAYTSSGEPGLNYLCHGYYRFFHHAAPYMDYMKSCLDKGVSPGEVMKNFFPGREKI